jgi:phage terminase small subunit
MGLPKRLTERQIKFAYELVTNDGKMNGKEAAVAAGYSRDRASVTASELQNVNIYPLVCEYIEKLRTEKSEQNKLMLRDNLFKLNRLMGKAIETLEKRIDCKPNEIIKICRSFKPIFNIS